MTGALVILAVTILAGVILRLTHREDSHGEGETPEKSSADTAAEECCGLHAVCEKKATGVEGPDYYEDEELDRFRGKEATDYSDEEIEEFRQVLYTLIPGEVFAWGGALTRRGVALPEPLRDEWIMLCEEK
ncbi:MAG: phospholipase [Muribaculaceae bacterium]|nr:phospholipase [Muribaculaceae bacterium]